MRWNAFISAYGNMEAFHDIQINYSEVCLMKKRRQISETVICSIYCAVMTAAAGCR